MQGRAESEGLFSETLPQPLLGLLMLMEKKPTL